MMLLLINSGYCGSSCDYDSGSKLASFCFYKRFYTREMQACAKHGSSCTADASHGSERSDLVLNMCVCVLICVPRFCVASQAPLSMGFSRQEYRSQFPFPVSGDLPYPGIEPVSLAYSALAGQFFITVPPGKPLL